MIVDCDAHHMTEKETTVLIPEHRCSEKMERSLVKSIKPIMDKTVFAKDTSLQDPVDQEDYKQMISEVLTELKARDKIR